MLHCSCINLIKRESYCNFKEKKQFLAGYSQHCLQVIFETELNETQKISKEHARYWLIFGAEQEEAIGYIPFNKIALVPDLTNNSNLIVNIKEIYHYQINTKAVEKLIGTWTPSTFTSFLQPQVKLRSNLNGLHFKTGAEENWPIVSFQPNYLSGQCTNGFFARIWWEIQNFFNITTNYTRLDFESAGTFGDNGKWTGIVGLLQRNEIDVAIAEMVLNSQRTSVLAYLQPLIESRYKVYFKADGNVINLTSVFKPFDKSMWATLAGWIIIMAFAIVIVQRRFMFYGIQEPWQQENSFFQIVLFIIQSLCQQGSKVHPNLSTTRLIFLICYGISSIIIPLYAASLISSLTNHKPKLLTDSLEELLNRGYPLITGRNTAHYDFFKNSKNTFYQEIFGKLMKPAVKKYNIQGELTAFKHVCTQENHALFTADNTLKTLMQTQKLCSLIEMPLIMPEVFYSIPFNKDNPYFPAIQYQTSRFREFGIIDRHEKLFWRKSRSEPKLTLTAVYIPDLAAIFIVLLVGFFVSFIVLIFERIVLIPFKIG